MYEPTRNRCQSAPQDRRFLITAAVALTLGIGFVLAAQSSGRADQFADPSDKERRPMWVPGEDIPMVTYLGAEFDVLPAPPR